MQNTMLTQVRAEFANKFFKMYAAEMYPSSESGSDDEDIDNWLDNVSHDTSQAKIVQLGCEDESNERTNIQNQTNNSPRDLSPVKTAQVEYTEITNGMLVLLQQNSTLYLHGVIEVTVLRGRVEILGFTLNEQSCHNVYSPRGSSFLYINTLPAHALQRISSKQLSRQLSNIGVDDVKIKHLSSKIKADDVLLMCKKIDNRMVNYLEKHVAQQIFPKNELRCNFIDELTDMNIVQTSESWNALLKHINQSSKVFFCGGKGVGKSTLLRYLVNRLLVSHKEILIIDLDPGQPEFTIPGCISATIVNEPLLGPNYTHIKKPERCIFVPHIDLARSPDQYLKCVEELLKDVQYLQGRPTLINYLGFTRALGLEIACSTIALVSPTLVVQIDSNTPKRNFREPLSVSIVEKNDKLFTPNLSISDFSVFKLQSCSDKCKGWSWQPAQVREMCIFSYLSNILTVSLSLTDREVPIYITNLSKMKIIAARNTKNPYAVANGNLVALCSSKNNAYECHGWGVVRAIDVQKNQLYLLTPLTADNLRHVDHLIVGSVNMPPSIHMTEDSIHGLVPYVSTGIVPQFSQRPKRNYTPRNK